MSNAIFNVRGIVLRRLSAVILLSAVATLCLSSYSLAEDSQIQFDIPAQGMRSALIEFADATDFSLIYDIGELGAMESNSVSGLYFPLEAMGIMLGDSGLKFKKIGEESIAISKDNQPPAEIKEKTEASSRAVEQVKMIAKKKKKVSEDAQALEEITVTGSRIRGMEGVGTSVIGIDRKEINFSDSLTVDKIIKKLPSIMDLGVTEMTRAQQGGEKNRTVSSSINIHGIGAYSTLILLDGHRMTSNGKSTEPGVFPALGVERLEVVADGASAVYGSDAVAGVVNIIPRRNLHGVETRLRYGSAADMNQWQAGAAAGRMWDSGQFMIAYEHVYRGGLDASDRPYYTADQRPYGGPDYRVTESSPGTIRVGSGPDEITFAIPEGGITPGTAHLLVPGTKNLFELFPGKTMLPEQEYDNANFTFNQVVNDIEFFADGFYSERDFFAKRGHVARSLTVPSTNAFFVRPPGTIVDSYVVDLSFADIPGAAMSSMLGSVTHWEITPGFRYDLPHGFQVKALYTYGESRDFSSNEVGLNNDSDAIAAALASSDPATALDVYGLGRTTPETIAAILSGFTYNPVENDFQGYEVSVNGPVFDLPGGTVSLAAGYEGQRYDVRTGKQIGNYPEPKNITWRPSLTRRVDSGYLEVYIPVVGRKNAATGIHRLELTAALRYDDYSDVGSTTNPKFGFNYSPIESLMFHGNYGTSFRAPLMDDVGESVWSSYRMYIQMYQNPEGGTVQGYTLTGTNYDLVPETATNWSLGAGFTPTEDTEITLYFFSVGYDEQINSYLSNLNILSIEDEFTGMDVILRGSAAGDRCVELDALGADTIGRGWPGGDPANVALFVDGRPMNLGMSLTQGIDFMVSHNLGTDTAGSFRFTLYGSYLTKYEIAYTSGGKRHDMLNQINYPLRFNAYGAVTWNYKPFTTQLAFRYVNSYENPAVIPAQKVDSWMPVDIVLRFNGDSVGWLGSFGAGLSVSLKAHNAFNEDPPYVNFAPNVSGGGGWDPSAADPTGRMLEIIIRKNF